MLAAWRFATGVRPAPLSPCVKSHMQRRFVHTHKASLCVTSTGPLSRLGGRILGGEGEGKTGDRITEWFVLGVTLQTISSQHLRGQGHPSLGQGAQGVLGSQQWGIRQALCSSLGCVGCHWGSWQLLLLARNFPKRAFTSLLLAGGALPGACIMHVAAVRRHLSFGAKR